MNDRTRAVADLRRKFRVVVKVAGHDVTLDIWAASEAEARKRVATLARSMTKRSDAKGLLHT